MVTVAPGISAPVGSAICPCKVAAAAGVAGAAGDALLVEEAAEV
jgi:3-polyprenyl-4-hydroxybenzoate decarboxylase